MFFEFMAFTLIRIDYLKLVFQNRKNFLHSFNPISSLFFFSKKYASPGNKINKTNSLEREKSCKHLIRANPKNKSNNQRFFV